MRLLACIDHSLYAESVSGYAAWLATRLDSAVDVLHVVDSAQVPMESADYTGAISFDASENLLEQMVKLEQERAKLAIQRGKVLLEGARQALEKNGVKQITLLERRGTVVETISEFEATATIMIIGKRGEAANFDKLYLGSNLERVVRGSQHPVFAASRVFKPIQKYVVAYDGGVSSMRAIEYIASSPVFKGLKGQIVMAGKQDSAHQAKVENAGAILRKAGHSVEMLVKEGHADDVLAEHVSEIKADLLVMGAYGHSRIRNLIVGSTTTEMIRRCQVPVMMFR